MDAIQERIQRRAYVFYCERGCIDGHEQEDWLRAEKEIGGIAIEARSRLTEAIIFSPEEERGMKPAKTKREKARANC